MSTSHMILLTKNIGELSMNKNLFFLLVIITVIVSKPVNGQTNNIDPQKDCIFDDVRSFEDGLAAIKLGDKWGFINNLGNIIVKLEYDDARRFHNGYAPVKKNWKWGFINKKGDIVVPAKYDDVGFFEEGLASVKLNGKWGFVDSNGNVSVPIIYEPEGLFDIGSDHYFKNGYAAVSLSSSKGNYGVLIDKRGNIVTPKEKYAKVYDYCDGLARFMVVYIKNGKRSPKYGYINIAGNEVISPNYDGAKDFCGGYAIVEKDEKIGIIDKNGKIIIPFKYDDLWDNHNYPNGLAVCKMNNKNLLIDMKGNELIPPVYDDISLDKNGSTNIILIKNNKKYGWINKYNKILIPLKYDNVSNFNDDEYAGVCINKKWGVIDKTGKVILDMKFDDINSPFEDGYMMIKVGDKYGFINKSRETLKAIFDKDDMFQLGIDYENKYDRNQTNKEYQKTAMEWYKKSATKGNKYACYKIGVNYMDGGFYKTNYTEAIKWLEKSISLSGDSNGNEYLYLGYIYDKGGYGVVKNKTKAIKYYKDGATIKKNIECYNQLAYISANEKNFTEALGYIDKAIRLSDKPANYYDSKGEIYLMMGKTEEAIQMWNKVMELDKNNMDFYKENSELYKQLKAKGKI